MSAKIDPRNLFSLLVTQLSSSARVQLGMSPNPVTGKREVNIDAAEMTVGILESLLFKTAGNLTKPEDRLLADTVKELKINLLKVQNQGR